MTPWRVDADCPVGMAAEPKPKNMLTRGRFQVVLDTRTGGLRMVLKDSPFSIS